MDRPKPSKPEGARLEEQEQTWLVDWTRTSSQPKSAVLKAAMRLLRIVTTPLETGDRMRFISRLSRKGRADDDEEHVLAVVGINLVKRLAGSSRKQRKPGAGTG